MVLRKGETALRVLKIVQNPVGTADEVDIRDTKGLKEEIEFKPGKFDQSWDRWGCPPSPLSPAAVCLEGAG